MLDTENGSREFVIQFGAGGNSERFLGWGWSQAEARHTWTIGHSSRVDFPRPAVAGTYLMLLEISPFLWDQQAGQCLTVFVNGSDVANFVVSKGGAFECTLPWSLLEHREWTAVTFEHPDAAKPSAVAGVHDNREIALAFERLSLFRQLEHSEAPCTAPRLHEGEALATHELMMHFESVGQNCEFGLVQRRCGAEPLGLLRFASSPLPVLMAALRARFEGLGEPGRLHVQASRDEYLVIDRRFGLLYHAWVKIGEADPEEILRREEKRLPFLRRKLIKDLEEGRKIFVYHGMEPLSRPLMLSLLLAVRAYGPTTLLWVELKNDAHPAGTVEWVTRGLLKGYMDRFAPVENAHDLSLDFWVVLCRNAYSLAHGTLSEDT